MVNAALLAFFGEGLGSILQQWSFIMMKLAQRKVEREQGRNLVEEKPDPDEE